MSATDLHLFLLKFTFTFIKVYFVLFVEVEVASIGRYWTVILAFSRLLLTIL